MAPTLARRIGEILVEAGLLSQSQLEQALFAQRKDGRKLGQVLVEMGLVSEVQLTQALSRQLGVPWVSLHQVDFSRALLNLVSRAMAERYTLIPVFVRREGTQGETLFVAMDDPMNEAAIEQVARAAPLPVKAMIACPSDVRAAIRVYYTSEGSLSAVRQAPDPAPPQPKAPAPPSSPRTSAVPPAPPSAARASAIPPAPSSAPTLDPPRASAPPPASTRASAPPQAPASTPVLDPPRASAPPPASTRASAPPPKSIAPPPSARTISLTLLDGTKISLPASARKRRPGEGDATGDSTDQLTARDMVSALRAVAHGVDASDVLGAEPRWEVLFSALLSILLRKGIIADWEFVEEFRKV
jgi:type IV pilus assembly protein PilB